MTHVFLSFSLRHVIQLLTVSTCIFIKLQICCVASYHTPVVVDNADVEPKGAYTGRELCRQVGNCVGRKPLRPGPYGDSSNDLRLIRSSGFWSLPGLYGAVTLVTPKIHMYPGGYCPTPVTPRIHRVLLGIRIWSSLANTSVKITKNSATSIEYENWDNISWPHQILRRNYMKFVFWICDRAQLKARFLAQWNISNITIKMLWNGSNK